MESFEDVWVTSASRCSIDSTSELRDFYTYSRNYFLHGCSTDCDLSYVQRLSARLLNKFLIQLNAEEAHESCDDLGARITHSLSAVGAKV